MIQAAEKSIITLVLLFSFQFSFAQNSNFEQMKTIEDTLTILSYTIINDSLSENRFAACHKFIPTLVKALKYDNSFDYKFDRLKSISIQYPADSTFRIFTWQLFVNNDEYRYYGAIQMRTEKLTLFPLADRSFEIEYPEQRILNPNNWYGAVYYKLQQFATSQGNKYLLFGFDGYSFFNKRKVMEVLSFEEERPVFGAPLILKNAKEGEQPIPVNRLILEYSAEAAVRLNYDEAMGHIMHDHLIMIPTNRGPVFVPDGSYEGYEWREGYWMNIEKVFNQVSKEAPREMPILGGEEKRNIFGSHGRGMKNSKGRSRGQK